MILIINLLVLLFFYSSELKRSYMSIVNSIKEIIQMFLFYIIIILFFAVIAYKFIGDME